MKGVAGGGVGEEGHVGEEEQRHKQLQTLHGLLWTVSPNKQINAGHDGFIS